MLPRIVFSLFLAFLSTLHAFAASTSRVAAPNVILIVADDMGYADLGCQGAPYKTPNLDRLAAEGSRFSSFYVAQAVCTASRAALLSGCYPNRVGLEGALNHTSPNGIHPDEWLLPEMFKARGYATAGMGKWHLGTRPMFYPTRHGFDEWTGIPYSNDNSKYHPVLAAQMPPLPWFENEKVTETDPDQSQFTRRLTQRATDFIHRNSTRPFFLYLAHIMPHVPIFASAKFQDHSGAGLYADVIQELDWSVGEVLAALKRHNIDDQTLVIFISDNGPFLSYGDHAGSAAPFRGGKLTTFEGGMRVPFLARWPGHIPANRVSDTPFMGIDVMPTLAELIHGKKSKNKIDGASMLPLLLGRPNAKAPHEALFYYSGTELHAVRNSDWKLHFPHPYLTVMAEPGRNGKPSGWGTQTPKSIAQSSVEGIASRHGYRVEQLPLSLYNLKDDPAETKNLASQHPDLVRQLTKLAGPIRHQLGDSLQNIAPTELRPAATDTSAPK